MAAKRYTVFHGGRDKSYTFEPGPTGRLTSNFKIKQKPLIDIDKKPFAKSVGSPIVSQEQAMQSLKKPAKSNRKGIIRALTAAPRG